MPIYGAEYAEEVPCGKTNKQDARDLNAESFVKWWLILIDEAVADRVRVSVKDICGLFAGYAVVATGEK